MDTVFIGLVIGLVIVGGVVAYLAHGDGPIGQRLGLQPRLRRLEFVERLSLEGGRKLLLVRRDDVEHLILIGGPIDLVVEIGIEGGSAVFAEQGEAKEPILVLHPASKAPEAASEPALPQMAAKALDE